MQSQSGHALLHLASPVHFVAVVPAISDHDVPVLRHGHALGTVQRAGEGVDKGEEGARRVKHLMKGRMTNLSKLQQKVNFSLQGGPSGRGTLFVEI